MKKSILKKVSLVAIIVLAIAILICLLTEPTYAFYLILPFSVFLTIYIFIKLNIINVDEHNNEHQEFKREITESEAKKDSHMSQPAKTESEAKKDSHISQPAKTESEAKKDSHISQPAKTDKQSTTYDDNKTNETKGKLEELDNFQLKLDNWDLDAYGQILSEKKIYFRAPIEGHENSFNHIYFHNGWFTIGSIVGQTVFYSSISSITIEQTISSIYGNIYKVLINSNYDNKTFEINFDINYKDSVIEFYKIIKTIIAMNEQKKRGGLFRKFSSYNEIKLIEDNISLIASKVDKIKSLISEYNIPIHNLIESVAKEIFYFDNRLMYVLYTGNVLSECVAEKDGFNTDNKKTIRTTMEDEDTVLLFLRELKKRIAEKWDNPETLDSAVYIILRNSVINYYYEFYKLNYNFKELNEFGSYISKSEKDNIQFEKVPGKSYVIIHEKNPIFNFYVMCYTCYYLHENNLSLPAYNTYCQTSKEIINCMQRLEKESSEAELFEKTSKFFNNEKVETKTSSTTIDQIDKMSGEQFEAFITTYFSNQGFNVTHTPLSGDYGVDVIIENEFIKIGIQTKRYDDKVTNSAVQEVVAGIKHYGLDKGMVITNNYFTKSAIELAKDNNVTLWDRNILKSKLENIKN